MNLLGRCGSLGRRGPGRNRHSDVVQITAECAKGVQIMRAGAKGSDLQWLILVRIENDYLRDQRRSIINISFYSTVM